MSGSPVSLLRGYRSMGWNRASITSRDILDLPIHSLEYFTADDFRCSSNALMFSRKRVVDSVS